MLCLRGGDELERLAHKVRLAEAPSRALVDNVAAACMRFGALKQAGKSRSFDIWCGSGAWLDVALALVGGELPAWSVRRIVKDDGVWICSLSRSPNLPIEFDDGVEAIHECLPLAILLALIEAKRPDPMTAGNQAAASIESASAEASPMCCDNFA